MEFSDLIAWTFGAAVMVVPLALILLVGAAVAVFPFAVLASAILRFGDSEPVATEPAVAPQRVHVTKHF